DDEVKMIRHQDEGADAPAEAADGQSEEFEEDLAVVLVVVDRSPLIAAGSDVMECASEVRAKCSCHAPRIPRDAEEGSKLFSLERKRAQTSSERKLRLQLVDRAGRIRKKKVRPQGSEEGAAPRVPGCGATAYGGRP